jgi:ribonuclease BN (tRNA processing enzyme)
VSDGTSVFAFLPDHSPLALGPGPEGIGVYHEAAITLASGADLLIHDAQHTALEMPRLGFLGHSAVEYAAGLGERCGVGRLVLFHHDPWRTDEEIDRMVSDCSEARVPVIAAFDGMVLDLA